MWIKSVSGVHYNCDRFDSIHFFGTESSDGFLENCSVVGVNIMDDRKPHFTQLSEDNLPASVAAKIVASIFNAIAEGKSVFDL